jgi:hypothetical protein
MAVLIERLPKPGGRRFGTERLTGADEQEQCRRNRQLSRPHLLSPEPNLGRRCSRLPQSEG